MTVDQGRRMSQVRALQSRSLADDAKRDRRGVSLGLANALTLLRFFLAVPIVVLIVHDRLVLALTAYVICGLTDVLDGMIARHRCERTEFGAVMDPLADIVTTAGVYGALLAQGWVPVWVFGVLMLRYGSLFLGTIVLIVAVGPIRFKATPTGKIVGVLQALVAILIITLAALRIEWQQDLGPVLFSFLGIIFGAVIVSQAVIALRHVRRGRAHARP